MAPPEQPDPLEELRARVRATREAAERLAADKTHPPRHSEDELEALVALLRSLRDLVPPELQHQVTEALRQVLLLLRAVIDYWVTRLEPGAQAAERSAEPQDIPID